METEVEKLMRYIGRSSFNDVMLKLRVADYDNWEVARIQILTDFGWTCEEYRIELADWIAQSSTERNNDAAIISKWINYKNEE